MTKHLSRASRLNFSYLEFGGDCLASIRHRFAGVATNERRGTRLPRPLKMRFLICTVGSLCPKGRRRRLWRDIRHVDAVAEERVVPGHVAGGLRYTFGMPSLTGLSIVDLLSYASADPLGTVFPIHRSTANSLGALIK